MKRFALVTLLGLIAITANAVTVSPFSLPQMNHANVGNVYNSNDVKNGVFVVEAYFLNCPYCNYNAHNVDDLASKFAYEPRVQVLDVGVDKNDSDYKTWIAKHSPNHPVLKDANRILIRQLGTTGYPSTYVLDCEGNVVAKTSGEWDSAKIQKIEAGIEKALTVMCQR